MTGFLKSFTSCLDIGCKTGFPITSSRLVSERSFRPQVYSLFELQEKTNAWQGYRATSLSQTFPLGSLCISS